MKFSVYSGTFNPVHLAHLIIAQAVKDELNLDKIIFIPAHIPPHRDEDLASPVHRLKMLHYAIHDNHDFIVDDIEYRANESSYSYNTIKKLIEEDDIAERVNFIIGSDAFSLIDTWYEIEKLKELVNFIIVPREENFEINEVLSRVKLKNIQYQVANIPLIDISSSYIRARIKKNKSIKYLVPRKVANYIYAHNLYKNQE